MLAMVLAGIVLATVVLGAAIARHAQAVSPIAAGGDATASRVAGQVGVSAAADRQPPETMPRPTLSRPT